MSTRESRANPNRPIKHTGIMISTATLTMLLRGKWHRLLDTAVDAIAPLLPLQRKVVFDNFGGRGMGDDPKYIALYLREHYPDARLIWLADNPQEEFPEGIEPVGIYSRKARFHLRTAKVWVDNIRSFPKPEKRRGQFYLQTWHGGVLGIKAAEAQIEDRLPAEYVAAAKRDAGMTDLMYADSDFMLGLFRTAFWYGGQTLKCNLPRLAPLFRDTEETARRIRARYGIAHDRKILLYAPTFRKAAGSEPYRWDYGKILSALGERFGGRFTMILRLHPNIAALGTELCTNHDIADASAHPDMQELIAAADAMVTDFSSAAFDCALTRKPVFLYAPDAQAFTATERNLLFPPAELPFRMNETVGQLATEIAAFDARDYDARLTAFFEQHGLDEHGKGDRQVAQIIAGRL